MTSSVLERMSKGLSLILHLHFAKVRSDYETVLLYKLVTTNSPSCLLIPPFLSNSLPSFSTSGLLSFLLSSCSPLSLIISSAQFNPCINFSLYFFVSKYFPISITFLLGLPLFSLPFLSKFFFSNFYDSPR